MTKNDIIAGVVMFIFAIVFAIGFNELNQDFMRYEVYHNGGKPCFIKDWKTGKRLPVTKELVDKASGDWTPCDPSQCE